MKLRHRHMQKCMYSTIYSGEINIYLAYLARVEVIDTATSVFVLVHPEDREHPPFIIENFTSRTLRYQQEGAAQADSLEPGKR